MSTGFTPKPNEVASLTEPSPTVKPANEAERAKSDDREQATRGSLVLNRLVPAPDHGAGFRRDPETGFVYYSSDWLSDGREERGLRAVK